MMILPNLAKGIGGVVNNMRKWELVWAEGLRHCCEIRSGAVSDWEKQVLDPLVDRKSTRLNSSH